LSIFKKTFSDKVFDTGIACILFITSILVLYPILYVVSVSISNPLSVISNKVFLFPVKPTLRLYELVLSNGEIWRGYSNTFLYTGVGTVMSLLLTTFGAYPLSRRDFYGRKFFMGVFVFVMFFNGGLIPTYLLVNNLGLYNSMWAVILPYVVTTYNIIIVRTFYINTIPVELYESANIDGANDIHIFFHIVIPLSAPIIAVMSLFYGVQYWNDWFQALLYLSSRSKYPLQLILREIILQNVTDSISGSGAADQEIIGDSIKYTTMIVAIVPILCLYPFLQKYFVKGVMIGAIKG
jgi:putative aldouronate transport system permease protein